MKPKVAFIVSKFPCYDEAFILRELEALSKRLDLFIFSLRKSKEKILHDEARDLLSQTVYVPYLFSWRIIGAQFQVFFRHPDRYLGALMRLVAGNFRSPEFLMKGLAFFPKAVYLAKWIRKNRIGHVHAYWATYPASVAMAVSEMTGIPFSFTGHAHDIYVDRTYLKEKIRSASFVTTCTQENKRHLIEVVGARHASPLQLDHWDRHILVNYHGLNLDKFQVNGKLRNGTFQILSVGTLQYYKGFQVLLPALALLRDRTIDFRCTIVGGGPLESDLRKHIRLLRLEPFVVMTGPLKQNEVIPFYKKADLFVLMAQPEWHWGIPNVLIEALAAKTPVITTRFGSVDELVKDTETGLIVPPKDVERLASAIEQLYVDGAFRMKLAKAGNELVHERFDLGKNIEAFVGKFL